jgi:hypothetical protein
MTPLIWALLAGIGLILFGAGLWSFVRGGFQDRPAGAEGGGEVPMSPQQRRAWWGLGIGAVMSAAILAVFIAYGPATYYQDLGFRLLTYGLFAVWLIAHLVMLRLTRPPAGESEVVEDERDPHRLPVLHPLVGHRGRPTEPRGRGPDGLRGVAQPWRKLRSRTGSAGCALSTAR